MKHFSFLILFITTLFSACAQMQSDEQNGIYHIIHAKLNPSASTVEVTDSIILNDNTGDFVFSLNANLKITSVSENVKMKALKEKTKAEDVGMDRDADGAPLKQYAVHFKDKSHWLVLHYSGKIHDDPSQKGAEYQRSFKETTGLIADKGVYLAGSTYWVPAIGNQLVTYKLTVELPEKWSSVTTGERLAMDDKEGHSDIWYCDRPQEEIYLIAARFTQYEYRMSSGYKAMAFLRTPDEALANKYLEVTEQYMQMYEGLIGKYPYTKFALVENFWQTGYGMPSFTLLGDKIIRFPFILHSSYPHELLHNWWGNSVYVDFSQGNWCEGITAYEADHLIKEQRGQGAAYRRSTLQKFTNFVNAENDFPISRFINRYDAASEAIGYGKALMMWHMLRVKLGDDNFREAWSLFYKNNIYRRASFADIQKAMEEASKTDLSSFFTQWLKRKGAPELQLEDVALNRIGDSYQLKFTLEQLQQDSVFKELLVPVYVLTDKMNEQHIVRMMKRKQQFSIDINTGKVLKMAVDPFYDVFRTLDPREVPPAFSKALGSEENVMILPSSATKEQLALYREYAEAWITADKQSHYSLIMDSELEKLPEDKTPWIIGVENKFSSTVSQEMAVYNSFIHTDSVKFENKVLQNADRGMMITTFAPGDQSRTMVFMTPGKKEAI